MATLPIRKPTSRTAISFVPGKGLQVLAKVGAFEPNFLRALLLLWIKLLFVAMLGLAAGSFLSFPVACVTGLVIYMVANLLGLIGESLPYFVGFTGDDYNGIWWAWAALKGVFEKLHAGEGWEGIKVLICMLATAVTKISPETGSYNPVSAITEGLVIPFGLLLNALLYVAVMWTGLMGVLAWLVFRRRELARVTV